MGLIAKKDLGYDSMGIKKTMHLKDYLADSSGQLSLNIMSGLIGQLTYFYTDKVGVAASVVAISLLVAKILDAFTDLIMGRIMDKGHSSRGIARPWFLRMAIPAGIITFLLFTMPDGLNKNWQIAYLMITNILATAVVYTAISIPYSAVMSLRTDSQEERGVMGAFRSASGYIIGMALSILFIPITNVLGGNRAAWLEIIAVLSITEALALVFLYIGSRENSHPEHRNIDTNSESTIPFRRAIKLLFKNKYWVIMLLVQLVCQISYGITGASGVYYAKWVLGNDNLVCLLGLVGVIPSFLAFGLLTPMVKKFGITRTMKFSTLISFFATGIRVFMPSSLLATIVFGAISAFGSIPPMALIGVLTQQCADYNEYEYGDRMLGMTNAAIGFGGKVGTGLGTALIGILLSLGAYDASLTVQSESAIYAIYSFSIYVPAVLYLLMYIALRKFDLEEKLPKIIQENQARREAKMKNN